MKNNKCRVTNNHFKKAFITSIMISILAGCGGGDKITETIAVTPPPDVKELTKPEPGQESYSMLRQEGTFWANEENEGVSLRGVNLGNWLSMETWMFDHNEVLGEGIVDQCTFENKLTERFGAEEKDIILKSFRDGWLTENDWDKLAEANFNVVRLPFFYDLIEDEANPKTIKEDAWHYLDWAIAQAKQREIYVILDLHGAVGRQGWEHHTGCEGKNEFWDNAEFIDRTKWLWGQISARYKDEKTVAAYGVLNEPWGTDSETLNNVAIDLYEAIRAEDPDHIVILPGHNEDGISAYGFPEQKGLTNVAFEMHFYPGIFGWGDINYETHRDWLTCGEDGDSGVCEWQERLEELNTPFLIGETQTWTGLGQLGGEVTRASYDIYNDMNWAVTNWSFKTVSASGGVGSGTWGYITNNGEQLLTKAETWSCNDWESEFDNACAGAAKSVIPNTGEQTKTMYLVIKTGSFNGTDIVYDNLALTNESTGVNVISNGEFGSSDNWNELAIWGDPRNYDFNFSAGEFAGAETGAALRVTAEAGHNSIIYQAVEIEANQSYKLSGKFKDLGDGGNDMWAEIYLVSEQPQEWQDVTGRVLPEVDINESSLEEIKSFFSSFATMEYVVNPAVKQSLINIEGASLFSDVPAKPGTFTIAVSNQTVSLTWDAPEGNIKEYQVYRSGNSNAGFEKIASTTDTSFSEQIDDKVYFYYVVPVSQTDVGYSTQVLASGELINKVPVLIEAEAYSSAHPDVKIEETGDTGGGSNIGHFETDYWVEYRLDVEEAGNYKASFRLASAVGNVSFQVLLNDELIETITVPETGGWQTYETVTIDLPLTSGESVLKLNSVDNQWNLNWIDIHTETEATEVLISVDNAKDGGSTATVSTVSDNDKSENVVSLSLSESGNMSENFVNYQFDALNAVTYPTLTFDMKDLVGTNTVMVTLIDNLGASWEQWTSDATVHNEWQSVTLDVSTAADSIDLSQVVELRLAQWNSGEYLITDVKFTK